MTRHFTRILHRALVAVLVAGTFLLAGPGIASGQNVFVKVDGIDGEAAAGPHRNWIVAGGYFDGITAGGASAGTMAVARQAGSRGGQRFENIKIIKLVDKASLPLRGVAAEGGMIKTVEIDLTRPDGQVFLHVVLEGVSVTEVTTEFIGSEAKETLSLAFRTIDCTYTEYDPSGKAKGSVKFGWDTRANRRL